MKKKIEIKKIDNALLKIIIMNYIFEIKSHGRIKFKNDNIIIVLTEKKKLHLVQFDFEFNAIWS